MTPIRKFAGVCTMTAIVVAAGLAPPAAADGHGPPRPSAKVLLDGLSSPKGLALTPDGKDAVIAQGAFGPPGPVLVHRLRGRGQGETEEVTEPLSLVDVAVSPADGSGWGIGTDLVLYHQLEDGSIVPVLDIPAYQATDPDPVDQDGDPVESNPYGLAILPNGDAVVADAAGNDVIRVTPDGQALTMARFDLELVATDHLPPEAQPPGGLPEEITAESVPTSIAVARNGTIFVGELKGFPFRPGSSRVWRIKPDSVDAWCSVNDPERACRSYAEGFTAIQDIAITRSTDRLYVYELAADGVLAFEAAFETGVFPPAVLLEVKRHKRTELAAGELSQPGGVVVGRDEKVYVTDGVFTAGRFLRIRR